jgi:hypothetical protein
MPTMLRAARPARRLRLPADPASVAIGLEQEFAAIRSGVPIDFRRVLPSLSLPGVSGIDPGDRNAVRTRLGLAVTADGAEAEIALPGVALGAGFIGRLLGWAGAGAGMLADATPGLELVGVSTHLSVSVPDEHTHAVCRRFTRTFAPALMLLMEHHDSDGLLLRPRAQRVELGTDYAAGHALAAGAVLAAGGVLACLAVETGSVPESTLPPDLAVRVVPAVERYGWYVDRTAFGGDLYAHGREAVLRTVDGDALTAQQCLEHAWATATAVLNGALGPGDRLAGDRSVGRAAPLPTEVDPGRAPSAPVQVAPVVAGRALDELERPGFQVRPAAATWHHVVYQIDGPRRGYAAVPARHLAAFRDAADSGALDRRVESFLAGRHRGRVLATYHQATRIPALWDELGGWESLAPPEPWADGVARLAPSTTAGPPEAPGQATRTRTRTDGTDRTRTRDDDSDPGGDDPPPRPLKGPLPPLPPEDRTWIGWGWPWIIGSIIIGVIGVIGIIGFLGGEEEVIVDPPPPSPTPSASAPPTPGPTPSVTRSEVDLVFPPEYGGFVEILRDVGMDEADIAVALDATTEDAMGDGFFSNSQDTPGNFGDDVDVWDVMTFWSIADAATVATGFNLSTFECGQDDGTTVTVCSRDEVQDMPAGEIAVVAQILSAPPASEAPRWQYSYALVSDTDGDPSNDFQFQPPFDFDLFRDTDTWWVVDNVDGEWSMGRFAASFAAPLPSAARVVIRGHAMVWFVPRSELPAPVGVRTTAFRHDGTFAPEASGADVIGADPTESLVPIADLDLPLGPRGAAGPTVEATSTPHEADTGAAADGEAAVREFVAAFEQALTSGDVGFLAARLDPAVIDRYGDAQCREYLDAVAGSAQDFEVIDVQGPVPITYETDGIERSVGDGYEARVRFRTSDGSVVESSPIYRIDGDTVQWFTDCGQPR